MIESNDYLDMQLSLETRMEKWIRHKLMKELKDFDLSLLVDECMFEEDDVGPKLEVS